MKHVLSAFLLLLAFSAFGAANAQGKIGLVSLVGPDVKIVVRQDQVGSNINKNTQAKLPTKASTLHTILLAGAQDGLKRAKPGAASETFAITGGAVDTLTAFDDNGDRVVAAARDTLRDLVAKEGLTELVLIAEARYRDWTETASSLAGVGFFSDGNYVSTSRRGYLAPFVFLQIVRVDAATLKPIASRPVKAYKQHERPESVSRFEDDALKFFSTEESSQFLTDVVRDSVTAGVAGLYAKS